MRHHSGSFQLFSLQHVLTLVLIGLIGIAIFMFRRCLRRFGWERAIRYLFACLLLASEISLQSWYISFHAWSLKSSLPLELSDMAVLLSAIMLFSKSRPLFKFLYFAGLGSSIQAILTPDFGNYSFPHFRFIEFFTAHGLVVLSCLFMIAIEKYRVTLRSLWATFLIINIYGAGIFVFNRWVGANYLYIMRKPKISSLMNYLGPWPWYLLSLEGLVIVIFYVLYAPFWITEKAKEK